VNALTITFIKPGTDLADVDRSLEIVRKDVALRIQQEGVADPKTKNKKGRQSCQLRKGKAHRGSISPYF